MGFYAQMGRSVRGAHLAPRTTSRLITPRYTDQLVSSCSSLVWIVVIFRPVCSKAPAPNEDSSTSFTPPSNLSGVCLAPDAANVTVSVFVRGSILPDATLTMTEPWTCTGTPAQLNSNSGPKWPTG